MGYSPWGLKESDKTEHTLRQSWGGGNDTGLIHQGAEISASTYHTKKVNFDYKCVPGDLWLKGSNPFQF